MRIKLYIKPSSSNLGAEWVCPLWAETNWAYPGGLAQRVVAVKIGDWEIPWPVGMTLVEALEEWKQSKT